MHSGNPNGVSRRTNDAISPKQKYDRERDLPRLIFVWPSRLAGDRAKQRDEIVARLRRALRAERRLGLGGHWSYDLTRHRMLVEALRHERDGP